MVRTEGEDEGDLRAEAQRICASAEFTRAPVMRRLLGFLIEETLAGRGDELKAYGVAVDGLGRSPDFDAQADSYPRVQVGRLRRMLDAFYAEHGPAPDGRRLSIPSGAYRVHSLPAETGTGTEAAPASSPEPPVPADRPAPPPMAKAERPWWRRRPALIALPALGAAGLALALLWPLNRHAGNGAIAARPQTLMPAPELVVEPTKGPAPLAESVDLMMGDALHRGWVATVRGPDSGRGARGPAAEAENGDSPPDYRLQNVLAGRNGRELFMTLWDARRDVRIWSERIDLNDHENDAHAALQRPIATLISPYGAIGTQERRRLRGSSAPGYACMLRYADYINALRPDERDTVEECLDSSLDIDSGFAPALAARAQMYLVRGLGDPARAPAFRARGLEMARRAVDVDPYSADAQMTLATISYADGQCAQGKTIARRALELNPYEPRFYARLGVQMFQCGDPDFEQYLRTAWDMDPGQPPMAAVPLIIAMANKGQGAQALAFAQSIPAPEEGRMRPLYDLTMAIAHAAAGDLGEAKASWQKVARASPDPAAGADAILSHFLVTPGLARASKDYLRHAQVIA